MIINLLLEEYNKNQLRLLVIGYLFKKKKNKEINNLLENISDKSRNAILNECSGIKMNTNCYFDDMDNIIINNLLIGDFYNDLENERKKIINFMLITFPLIFSFVCLVISKNNLSTINATILSIFSISFVEFILRLFSHMPKIKYLRYLYIKRSLEKVKNSLIGIELKDISLKESIILELRKFDSRTIKKIELKDAARNLTQPSIEINNIKKIIGNEKNIAFFNKNQKNVYKLELISSLTIKNLKAKELLQEREKGCPIIFFYMNKIIDIYDKQYTKQNQGWNQLKLEYENLLKKLVDHLFQNKEFTTIGNIIYQGYSTTNFTNFDIFYGICSKENWLDAILDDMNKNRDDFIKNIPTMLIYADDLVNKSSYPTTKEKMKKLRASIPLSIYNRAYQLIEGV